MSGKLGIVHRGGQSALRRAAARGVTVAVVAAACATGVGSRMEPVSAATTLLPWTGTVTSHYIETSSDPAESTRIDILTTLTLLPQVGAGSSPDLMFQSYDWTETYSQYLHPPVCGPGGVFGFDATANGSGTVSVSPSEGMAVSLSAEPDPSFMRVVISGGSATPLLGVYTDGCGNQSTQGTFGGGKAAWTFNLGESPAPYDESTVVPTGNTIDADLSWAYHDFDGFTTVDSTRTWSIHLRRQPLVSIGDATVSEGDGGSVNATFPVRLSVPATTPVSVTYSTTPGTAVSSGLADFVAKTAQVLTIPAGKTGGNITVTVKGDRRTEPTETFAVNVTSATGATIDRATGTGTILDNDLAATPLVSVGDVTVVEGNAGNSTAVFDVTLDHPVATTVSVPWHTVSGTATAPADFSAVNGTFLFAAGTTSKPIYITIKGDTTVEANETASIVLGAPTGAVVGDGSGALTILDDDTTPSTTAISVGDVQIAEGSGANHNATFTIRLANPSATPVGVTYATSPVSATAGTDYATKTGTFTIPAGAVTATFVVSIVADGLHEADETFTLTLSAPTGGATLGRAVGTGTIVDDDVATAILSIGEGAAVEGQSGTAGVSVPITLTQPSATPVTVLATTADGTATSPADYNAVVNKLVTIPAGQTAVAVAVTVKSDLAIEGNETFTITLTTPTGATLGRAVATYTILDDD